MRIADAARGRARVGRKDERRPGGAPFANPRWLKALSGAETADRVSCPPGSRSGDRAASPGRFQARISRTTAP